MSPFANAIADKEEETEEKEEEMTEDMIFEEGGHSALWKFKTMSMLYQCGCGIDSM